MKIILYLDRAEQSPYGSDHLDGSVCRIVGNAFDAYSFTAERVEVAKLLAPIVPTHIPCIGLNYRHHATIGAGTFLAASLRANCALDSVTWHEFQHSIFNRNTNLITAGIECLKRAYQIGDAPGIVVEPTRAAISMLDLNALHE